MPRIRNLFIPALAVLMIAAGIVAWGHRHQVARSVRRLITPGITQPASMGETSIKKPDYTGETIDYNVYLGKFRIGESHSRVMAKTTEQGKPLNVIVFETKVGRFWDKETIFSDPETFLPIRIERDVLNFLVKELITEEYDQTTHTVTITKHKGKNPGIQVIKKQGPINNPVLLPQYVRQLPELDTHTAIIADFPLKHFEITMAGIEEITVPAGTFSAYRFESTPRQIEIWITADNRRIPIKIKGNGLIGYVLMMRSYQGPDTANE